MVVKNQRPVDLNPAYKPTVKGNYSPIKHIEDITSSLFTPVANTAVTIKDDSGNDITESDVTNAIIKCLDESIDVHAENFVKELFGKTLLNYKTSSLPVNNIFAVQAGIRANMPEPSSTIIYTPAVDIIPVCKKFLNGTASYDELFSTFAFYTRCNIAGFYFATEGDFDDFKTFVKTNTASIQNAFPPSTIQMLSEFDKIKLDGLTESLKIRNDDNDNNEEYSFARIITKMLNTYAPNVSPTSFGLMPFAMSEHFSPKNLIFINIDAHAHASASQIKKEWELVHKSLKLPIKMIKNGKLTKLTSTARSMQKYSSMAAQASTNTLAQVVRARNQRFRKTKPSHKDYVKILMTIIKNMAFVGQSQNIYKMYKNTFNKPSRRDPDNFDLQGKILKTTYKPDIHIYLDTSGSISEINYQAAIKSCINIARKLNINLYINSFSHVLSQTTLLPTKDKSLQQTYAEFQKLPKVSGGTDYDQIWRFINKSPKRCKELSLIITDFEYWARNEYVKHPKNLYYMPCDGMDWNELVRSAKSFCQSAEHNDPFIRKHILM